MHATAKRPTPVNDWVYATTQLNMRMCIPFRHFNGQAYYPDARLQPVWLQKSLTTSPIDQSTKKVSRGLL